MPTALLTGSCGPADPGIQATQTAISRALPGWRVVAANGAEHERRARPRLRELLRADAAILTGAVFTARSRRGRSRVSMRAALAAATAMRARGRPRAVIGASAGPLPTTGARAMARALVHSAALLVLRDEESARALEAAGAPSPFRIGADPAWTEVASCTQQQLGERTITVVVSEADGLVDRLVAALRPLLTDGFRFRLLPWATDGTDRRIARAFAKRLQGDVVVRAAPGALRDAPEALAGSRLVIGLGYYPLVAAAAAGIPFLALRGEAGMGSLARDLDQPVAAASADPAEITAAVRAALDGPHPDMTVVRGEIDSANESLRLLRLLLSGGDSDDASEVEGLPLAPEPGR